eukprot:s3365_g6.t1
MSARRSWADMRPGSLVCQLAAFLFWLPHRVWGQGFSGYTPPAPNCPAFSCPSGQLPVGKEDIEIVSYGCKEADGQKLEQVLSRARHLQANLWDELKGVPRQLPVARLASGMALFAASVGQLLPRKQRGLLLDPNWRLLMGGRERLEPRKCQQKRLGQPPRLVIFNVRLVCKGDQNCQLQAMVADFSGDPYDTDKAEKFDDKKYDPMESKCRSYSAAQSAVCQCVPRDEAQAANARKLQDSAIAGEIKDVDEVWKKWKGKDWIEASMFMALATKYKDKAVRIKEKPKPPPYEPPSTSKAPDNEPAPAPAAAEETSEDDESKAYEAELKEPTKRSQLLSLYFKRLMAEQLKNQVQQLKDKELARLKEKKDEALKAENYLEAKSIKARIAKLEL